MQPKSTPSNSIGIAIKIFAIALIFMVTTQISFAQQTEKFSSQKPGYENTLSIFEKQKALQANGGIVKDNDAGIISKASEEINSPQAICTTWNFSITAGDPPTSLRAFRDGVPKTCAVPGTCQAGIAGAFNYQIFQWVNPIAQCVTVTYNATNASFSFVTVHNAPPTLTNLCANWVGDPGSSATVGTPIVFSFNGTAGTTYYFLVTNVGAPPSNGSIQIDAGTCFGTPCTGTPAPGNTIGTPNPVGSGAPLTLSIQNNPPSSGFSYQWQSAPAASGPWTTIGTTASNTFVTSQTVVTWYRCNVTCTPSGLTGTSTPVLVNLLACSWTASTVYPINVLDQANVTVGSTFYSFAGVSANAVIGNSYRFDGTVWTPIAATPQPLEYPAACTDGANIFILGGASTTGASLNTLYRYNIASNTYTTLAPFVNGAWNPTAVYLSGKIYKFCGTGAAGSINNLEIYDVASNTWTNGANYPLAISFVSAIARGGFIYAGGGVQTVGTIASAKTYRYDPASNTWDDASIADLPASRWGAAADFYNNTFVMAGGYLGGAVTITNTATAWNQGTNTWSALPDMLGDRARMGGATFGTAFHVVGGRSTAAAGFVGTNTNQRLFCIPPTPCSGTPDPGLTISSSSPVCSGVTFTLSVQNNPFVSGLTYLWQSAPAAAGPWTNLAGGTNVTHSLSQTGATWYRCIVSCTPSGLSGTSTPLLVADGQGVFTSQPANTSVECGKNAVISFTATGNSLTYSWEYRTSPAGFWLNVTGAPIAGAAVSGQTTNTLTLTNVSAALNGYQFRGLIQGPCTAVDFTNIITLTVTPYIVTVNPPLANPVTICAGTIQQISISNTVAGSSTASFTSGPLNFNIPDNIATPSLFTIPVSGIPGGSLVTGVRIHLNMTHTYPADMVINLKGTQATNILSLYKHNTNTDNGAVSIPTAGFFDAVCSSTGSIQWRVVPTPFRYGITTPTGPFAADALNGVTNPGYTIMDPTGWVSNATTFASLMNGGDPNGTWTLAMCDGGPADLGNFTGWTIDIDYTAPVFAQGVWTGPAGTMWNNPAANIPYVAGTPQSTIYVTPSVNSNYTVIVTTATPCVSAPKVVTVNVTNPITGLVAPANKTVCVGTNTTFSVSPGGGPLTYVWEVSVNNGLTWSVIAGATSATLS
ncbi:MAG: Kelch repeat-containing protein, partial [Chitinophagaceae bacterium]